MVTVPATAAAATRTSTAKHFDERDKQQRYYDAHGRRVSRFNKPCLELQIFDVLPVFQMSRRLSDKARGVSDKARGGTSATCDLASQNPVACFKVTLVQVDGILPIVNFAAEVDRQ